MSPRLGDHAAVEREPTNPNHKGNIAEAEIAAAAVRCGLTVLKPLTEHARYDLAFDLGGSLMRVQCKWARLREDVVMVNLAGYRLTSRGSVSTRYSAQEVDAIAAYCGGTDACYLIPIELAADRRAFHLRLRPARNGQRAWVNWAADYEFPGAIAQLEERHGGTVEVAGSSPAGSIATDSPAPTTRVGANEFRERLSFYMARAAAGGRVDVTRRGRPYVRVSPAPRARHPDDADRT